MIPGITLPPSWQFSFLYLCDLQIPADMVISPFRLADRLIHPDPQTSPEKSPPTKKQIEKGQGMQPLQTGCIALTFRLFGKFHSDHKTFAEKSAAKARDTAAFSHHSFP